MPFELKIANLSTDGQILELARKAAKEILDEDPQLSDSFNQIYKRQLDLNRPKEDYWSGIS